jgi:hypothetical protein
MPVPLCSSSINRNGTKLAEQSVAKVKATAARLRHPASHSSEPAHRCTGQLFE